MYVIAFVLGAAGGASCAYVAFFVHRRSLADQAEKIDVQTRQVDEASLRLKADQQTLEERAIKVALLEREYSARAVSYAEMGAENAMLKRDLQNVDVSLRKLMLDRQTQTKRQDEIEERTRELGGRYLKENVKWIGTSLTANNFVTCKQRLLEVVERCRSIGFEVPREEEQRLVADLKAEFERLVRVAFDREEQARIKAQIREEQKLEREIDREMKQVERERAAIQSALDRALAEAQDQHSEEVERLKARLAEAEAKAARTKSRAELTKSGYIYVISNLGSFGDSVFKIGMTRRLEPLVRVRELGDASVPFPYDVHMMISSDDAPALENALHRALHKLRINKVNPRKEFFRADVETIRRIVLDHHGEVEYLADHEALEYRQSLSITGEDAEYIERVYDEAEDKDEAVADDA